MHKRKIQLVAGTTYSVSLPKIWVKKNKLKEKSEVSIQERDDQTLIINPGEPVTGKLDKISLNIDDYDASIDQVIFALYYLGIENITLFSKNGLSKGVKSSIRKTLDNMSGTEVSYEDKNKIMVRVLLDKSKVEITQLFYRVNLIIDSTISNIAGELDIQETRLNENEVDRLYHLIAKIITVALNDSPVLASSKIQNVTKIPSYFLIGKRLEHIADNLNDLCEYLYYKKKKLHPKIASVFLPFVSKNIGKSISHLRKNEKDVYQRNTPPELKEMGKILLFEKDAYIRDYLEHILRYVEDVEEEVTNISFYNQLIRDKAL